MTYRVFDGNEVLEVTADRVEVDATGALVFYRYLGRTILTGSVFVPFKWIAAGVWRACDKLPEGGE